MSSTDFALREAVDWHLRIADGDADVWHAFTAWLEADTAHADAYDRVAMDDRLLDDRPAERQRTERRLDVLPEAPRRARRWGAAPIWGGAIAALMVGAIGLHGIVRHSAPDPYEIVAPATATRSVTLADGTQIALNAGARLRLDRNAPRLAQLESGEALFRVRHDARHPFRVEAAGQVVEDLGTVFDVAARGRSLRVAVAEGSVAFRCGADHIVLKPGMVISLMHDGDAELGRIDPALVGDWRGGHVDFDDVRLADVAERLHLAYGMTLAVAPGIADRRFSGVLRSDRGADALAQSLAALSGTRARQEADGWHLEGDGAR